MTTRRWKDKFDFAQGRPDLQTAVRHFPPWYQFKIIDEDNVDMLAFRLVLKSESRIAHEDLAFADSRAYTQAVVTRHLHEAINAVHRLAAEIGVTL